MTLCVKTGYQCICQPDEGVFCPDYKPDAYVQCLMDAITELRAPQSETARSTADQCNRAMVFKEEWTHTAPTDIEPWYSHWVGELTAQGLHAKTDIATVLAILSTR